MPSELEVVLHDVEDHGELREYQDAVAAILHLWKKVIQDRELPAPANLRCAETAIFDGLKRNIMFF